MEFRQTDNRLEFCQNGESVRIEAWGEHALRVRATMQYMKNRDSWSEKSYALTEIPKPCHTFISIAEDGRSAEIVNGILKCTVNEVGILSFYKRDILILREYYRCYGGTISRESRCLKIRNRTWKGIIGGSEYRLEVRFEANRGEKLYGMGQYQQQEMNLKGCLLELAQRNSQISVPFAVSDAGYGFLWNNPAVGKVTFGNNYTEWIAEATGQMDYWITARDTPKEILESYTAVTGRAEMFPDTLMGLWQCKLRYRTPKEVLEVAHRYHDAGIPLDQIVIDFFHWTVQGDWKFDPLYWQDPKAMVAELHQMGIRVMVSVWPSVDRRSENYYPMNERGLLIRTERGEPETYDYQGDCMQVDAFHPEARAYIWEKCRQNYYDIGIDGFWLDNTEPDFGVYDFDNLRYCVGPALSVSNLYPQKLSRAFYDAMKPYGKPVVNLVRCCWAGSQKYGNVVWSGDVPSTFEAFRDQIACGLNMGMAGIPWWTTDIGGFMTDDVRDPCFRQLLIRWYQFAVYSAVLRMHGDRGPYDIPPLDERDFGGGYLHTGQDNELWSYGEENYRIMKKYLDIRLRMRDYIQSLFEEAHTYGYPLIRPMFFEFPEDKRCYTMQDQYMFGSRYLVAPILHFNEFERDVYLPDGVWRHTTTQTVYTGGTEVHVCAPLEEIPVFEKL